MSNEDYADIIAFASDFSGRDAAIVERVKEMAAHPPTDMETIGFYSGDEYPSRARLFLATVNLLDAKEKLYSVEDKYASEIFSIWQEKGVIQEDELPPLAKSVFGPLLGGEQPSGKIEDYQDFVWNNYAHATRELEKYFAERGRVLLSIDATEGDTMFFALVPADIAERWRDRALAEYEQYTGGVRSPMWDRFWVYLNYSTHGLMGDESRKDLPPGTAKRVDAIPFAK